MAKFTYITSIRNEKTREIFSEGDLVRRCVDKEGKYIPHTLPNQERFVIIGLSNLDYVAFVRSLRNPKKESVIYLKELTIN